MFRKRHDDTALEHEERRDVDVDEQPRRGEYARQLARAIMTLVGAAAAGLLIWFATQIGDDSTGEYWAVYGLLAAAGLTLALSQLLGGWTKWGWPRISAAVFLLGFLPVLIGGGWLLLAHQPEGAEFQGTAMNWAGDVGAGGLVEDFGEYLPVVALAIGLIFGFTFDTRGPRVRTVTAEERRDVEPAPAYERTAADEPLTAERRTETADRSEAEPEPVSAPRPERVATGGDEPVTPDEPRVTRHGADR